MSSRDNNLSHYEQIQANAGELKIGIVVSEWNHEITKALLSGCEGTLIKEGVKKTHIQIIWVPGSFELPTGARMLDDRFQPDAIICLGCVIKGETRHDEYINQAVSQGIMQLGVLRGKPFIFGVLTPDNQEQAMDRSGGKHGNKGVEAAITAIKMALLKKQLTTTTKKIGFNG